MVKIKFEIVTKNKTPQKRKRGFKPNIKKKIQNRNKDKEPNEQRKPDEQNENSSIFSKEKNYSPKIRYIVLFHLLKMVEQINKQIKLPDNFILSCIAFLDNYLNRAEKFINPKEMEMALFGCLDILDKEQNINIFSNSNFKNYIDFELEYEILEVVDLEVYPEKLYDHFNKFYNELVQNHYQNKIIINYLNEFKAQFLNYAFFTMFHIKLNEKKPFTNFLSCMLLTYERIKEIMPKEAFFLEEKIKEYIIINEYSNNEYSLFKKLINESIYIYNNLLLNKDM